MKSKGCPLCEIGVPSKAMRQVTVFRREGLSKWGPNGTPLVMMDEDAWNRMASKISVLERLRCWFFGWFRLPWEKLWSAIRFVAGRI